MGNCLASQEGHLLYLFVLNAFVADPKRWFRNMENFRAPLLGTRGAQGTDEAP
jgi:hypothetical protein